MTKRFAITAVIIPALFFVGALVANAQYFIPGFTLQNNSQCTGGTLVLQYGDVQDTGANISAKPLATMDCQNLMTGPNQCCSVQYRRATPAAPAIGSHVFLYEIYQGGTVGPSVPPSGTLTSSFQHWAGNGGGTGSVTPAAITASLVANPNSIYNGEQSLLTWSSTGASQCVGTNFSTNGATSGSVIVTPSVTTSYSVSCAAPGSTVTNPPTTVPHTEGEMFTSAPTVKADMLANGGVAFTETTFVGRTLAADQTTMNRVCHVLHGAGSTATSIGARGYGSCGNNGNIQFNGTTWASVSGCTGAHLSGSFSCIVPGTTSTTPGSNASASAVVTVSQPNQEPEFTASCRAHPTSANTGQDVTWSSTVTGGEGTYSYEWTGSENLTGTGNQVVKRYNNTGQKTASLTVTYTPSAGASGAGTPPPAAPTPTPTPTPTPPVNPPPTTIPPVAICPAIGWITPVTPCSGVWAPTYSTGGCQNGWQCIPYASGGGGYAPPDSTISEPSFLDTLLNFESPNVRELPSIERVDGSVLGVSTSADVMRVSALANGPSCQSGGEIVRPTEFYDSIIGPDQWTTDERCCGGLAYIGYESNFNNGVYCAAAAAGATPSQCTPTARNGQWYTSSESGVLIFNEGLSNPYDCALAAETSGYQYWNQTTSISPGQYDPAYTICMGYRAVTGTISMPGITLRADGIYSPSIEYRSGSVCSGSIPGAVKSCTLNVSPSVVQAGQSAILSWTTSGVTSLSINNGVGSVTPVASGSRVVTPSASITYAGTASVSGTSTTNPPTTVPHTEGEMFTSAPTVKADMLANGGVAFTETTFVGRTLAADQTTMNRVCHVLHGAGSTATSIGARGYGSCGNNGNIQFNGTTWASVSGCTGAHLSGSFSCIVPGTTSTTPGSSLQCGGNAAITVVQPSAESRSITVQCENSVQIGSPQCSDGLDNDGDGDTDYPDDSGCTSDDDDDESDNDPPQCSDGIDNDGDYKKDYPKDKGCTSPDDDDEVDGGAPQCSDGDDNDGDGKIDYPIDPGCASDEDDDERNSGTPQCSDGLDNDGDGDIDASDGGCTGGPGGGYNPNDDSEGGGSSPACSDGLDNDGDGNVDYPDDLGCSSANDNDEASNAGDINLSVSPPLIKKGQSCTLTVAASSVSSCSLTGPGVSRTFAPVGGSVNISVTTPALSLTSKYTLSCVGMDGRTVSKTADCRIAPSFEEF